MARSAIANAVIFTILFTLTFILSVISLGFTMILSILAAIIWLECEKSFPFMLNKLGYCGVEKARRILTFTP